MLKHNGIAGMAFAAAIGIGALGSVASLHVQRHIP